VKVTDLGLSKGAFLTAIANPRGHPYPSMSVGVGIEIRRNWPGCRGGERGPVGRRTKQKGHHDPSQNVRAEPKQSAPPILAAPHGPDSNVFPEESSVAGSFFWKCQKKRSGLLRPNPSKSQDYAFSKCTS
jgi:hypothetical protein